MWASGGEPSRATRTHKEFLMEGLGSRAYPGPTASTACAEPHTGAHASATRTVPRSIPISSKRVKSWKKWMESTPLFEIWHWMADSLKTLFRRDPGTPGSKGA